MQYKRYNELVVARLAPGDEILACLMEIAEKEGITCANVTGLGASAKFTLDSGEYDVPKHEISSIVGNISQLDEKVFLHIHANFSAPDGNVIGGHLKFCEIFSTCELFIHIYDVKLTRMLPYPEEKPGWVWLDPK